MTTQYDAAQRVVSTVEKTSGNIVITGYEYTYDALGRITCEKSLADNKKYDMTYDNLSRVTAKTVTDLTTNQATYEAYQYDNGGNVISSRVSGFDTSMVYGSYNRLISCNGHAIAYDCDGNMTSGYMNGSAMTLTYDSGNRLINAGDTQYIYDAESIRSASMCCCKTKLYINREPLKTFISDLKYSILAISQLRK